MCVCLLTHWKPLCRRSLSRPVYNADVTSMWFSCLLAERQEGSICWGLFIRNCTVFHLLDEFQRSIKWFRTNVWPLQIPWRHETRKSLKVMTLMWGFTANKRKSVVESLQRGDHFNNETCSDFISLQSSCIELQSVKDTLWMDKQKALLKKSLCFRLWMRPGKL